MAISVPHDAGGKLPPQNQEAETSVLGAILLSEQALDGLMIDVKLRPEDFYRERHRLIFRSMLRLKEKSDPEPIDALTVSEELARAGELEEAGGAAYIHSLPNLVPSAGNVRQYGRIVKEHALMRRLLDTSRKLQDDVFAFSGDPRELLEQAEGELFRIAQEDRTGELRAIEAVLHDELDKLELISREGMAMTGTPTGFTDIDEITGGFQPGNLIVLAARPSMGKCLAGSTLVYDPATGARTPIADLVARGERGEDVYVAALDERMKLRRAKASAFMRSGKQQLFRLTTKLGRQIELTANHPLLSFGGWRELRELAVGERVAVPRSLAADAHVRMRDAHVVLLAALIADGNLTNRTPRFCYGPDSPVLGEVERAVEDLGLTMRHDGRGSASISATGRPANHNWHVGRGALSRHLLEELAEEIGDAELTVLARSDVWWDTIASIDPVGEQETYDLTVPDHHNFVANDLIVHNSALVTNIAENASVEYGKPVALFSLEMSETELAQRFIASQAKLNGDDLRKGRVRTDRWPKVVKATEKLAASPLYIDDSSDLGILDLRAKARRLHSRSPLGLVIVDYLQLMRPENNSDSRVEQIGQISRGLKMLARELRIPVIAVSQLSRAVESRPDKKPLLSDLRESGQIEQDADLVMFIYRDEYYNRDSERPGEADLIIAKHRNGPVGEVVLTFLSRYPKFANMYREREDFGGMPPAPMDGAPG